MRLLEDDEVGRRGAYSLIIFSDHVRYSAQGIRSGVWQLVPAHAEQSDGSVYVCGGRKQTGATAQGND